MNIHKSYILKLLEVIDNFNSCDLGVGGILKRTRRPLAKVPLESTIQDSHFGKFRPLWVELYSWKHKVLIPPFFFLP